MTTEKHDPWALLAAARVVVYEYGPLHEDIAEPDLLARIDAALAEHDADSATPVVEPDDLWWTPSSHRAKEGKYEMHVWRMSLKQWGWSTCVYQEREVGSGFALTLDEAKAAAIAAARGMK